MIAGNRWRLAAQTDAVHGVIRPGTEQSSMRPCCRHIIASIVSFH